MAMASSYSVDGECYCVATLENGMERFYVETDIGWKTVQEVCDIVGQGPAEGRIYYNDIQCGHGPPSAAGDEQACPGRVDIGVNGCGHVGPKWRFETLPVSDPPSQSPSALVVTSERPSNTPSMMESTLPTLIASQAPSTSHTPSSDGSLEEPSSAPTFSLSDRPTQVQNDVGALPESSAIPSDYPSRLPSLAPSSTPSALPTASLPTMSPTDAPATSSPVASSFQTTAPPTSSATRRGVVAMGLLSCQVLLSIVLMAPL